MQSRYNTFPQSHTETISCPKCRTCGVINWDFVQTPDGPKKDFAGLSGNFYERMSKNPPHTIEVVCVCCGTPAPRAPIQLTPQSDY